MNPIIIYGIIRKLKSELQQSGIVQGEPIKLDILCNYMNDTATGVITTDTGATAKRQMKLSESEIFSTVVKQQVKSKLNFDKIDIVEMIIDLREESISAKIYYELKGEKLFLELEKI